MAFANVGENPGSSTPCDRSLRTAFEKPEPSRRRDIQRAPSIEPLVTFSRDATRSPSAVHLTFGMCGER
eukprot:5961976-Prymnesium_polylepis.1